jgi:hypothetical protein
MSPIYILYSDMAMNLVLVARLLESTDLLCVIAESSLSPSAFKKWTSSFQLAWNFPASGLPRHQPAHSTTRGPFGSQASQAHDTSLGLIRIRLITHFVCILYLLPVLMGNVRRDVLHKNKSPPPPEISSLIHYYRSRQDTPGIFRLKVDSFPPITRPA